MVRVAHIVYGIGLVLAVALGCERSGRRPGATPVIAPDGLRAMHVSCGEDEARCYLLAGQSCPQGYYIQPTVSGRGGNFLVRCRSYSDSYASATPTASPPAYGRASPSSTAYRPAPQAPAPSAPSTWPQAAPDAAASPGDAGGWPPPEPRAPAEPWPDDLGY